LEITLDQSTTAAFRKEGKFKCPEFKIVLIDGKKYLLKPPTHFFLDDGTWLSKEEAFDDMLSTIAPEHQEEVAKEISPDTMYDVASEKNDNEERADRIARYLNVSKAHAMAVDWNGTPCIAYAYLGDEVRDCGFGSSIKILEQEMEGKKGQQVDLAKIAVFKFITSASLDDGQFLQQPSGRVYVSDISISNTLPALSTPEEVFDDLIHTRHEYFIPKLEVRVHQLQGLRSPELREMYDQLENCTLEKIHELMKVDDRMLTEKQRIVAEHLLSRFHIAGKLFRVLAEKPELALIVSDPNKFTTETRERARKEILASLAQS